MRTDLSGGGLFRSFGGCSSALEALRAGQKVFSDQRILGESELVETVLKRAEEAVPDTPKSRAEIMGEVEKTTGVPRGRILGPVRDRRTVRARAIYCYLCKEKARASGTDLKMELGLSHCTVAKLIAKGRILAEAAEKMLITS